MSSSSSPGRPPSGRTVLVIGAGPGGMEAARVAAERGHRAVLVDREPEVGGRLRAAARLPHREGWQVFLREAAVRLDRAGVECMLGRAADARLVADVAPNAVVVAMGAAVAPRGRDPAGPPRLDAASLLDGAAEGMRCAVVLGGGPVALNVAEWLAARGADAVVVSDRPALSEDGQPGLLERVLATGRVTIRLDRVLRAAAGTAVTIVRTGAIGPLFEERLDAVDAIVETESLTRLPTPAWVAAAVPANRLHAVGDCLAPRSALEAIHEGALAGLSV